MTKVQVCRADVFKKVNPIHDPEGRRRVKVGERFYVMVQICEGMVSDGMWTTLRHAARFADKAAAEKLADRVLASIRKAYPNELGGLNLDYWIWLPSPCQAFSVLQKVPTAREYDIG